MATECHRIIPSLWRDSCNRKIYLYSRTKVCLPGRSREWVWEHLCFINQRRPPRPRAYRQGMEVAYYPHYNPNQNEILQPWCPSTHPSWSKCPPSPSAPSYRYRTFNHPFHSYPPQSSQWGNRLQGWRNQTNQPPSLFPPPQYQPHLTHHTLPNQPQIISHPSRNLNYK